MMSAIAGTVLQSTILVIAILIVRKALGERLHVYIRYGLWLLVALRLVIPVNLIDSPVSALRLENVLAARLTERAFEMGESEDLLTGSERMEREPESAQEKGSNFAERRLAMRERIVSESAQDHTNGINDVRKQAAAFDRQEERTAWILTVIWVTGGLSVGGFFAAAQLSFRRRLYRTREICQGRLLEETSGQTWTKCRLRVYHVNGLEASCLAGVVHPAVYIGADLKTDSDYFRYTITHEQVHYLHGDHLWALLRVVLVSVYWFHPFVWIAAAASVRDGELACDYGTIRRLGEKERLTYGEMLLALSRSSCGRKMYSYGTMLHPGKFEIEERILRLAGGNGSRMAAGILTVLFMLAMAGCAFTGTKQRTETETEGTAAGNQELVEDNVEEIQAVPDHENGPGEDSGRNEKASGTMMEFNPDVDITKPRQITAMEAAVSEETELGADGPTLDYAGQMDIDGENSSVIIFHDYFGLVVYDLTHGTIVHSLDLSAIGCHFTQGDNVCQVAVSEDGTKVWLHPLSKRYLFRYDVEEEQLWQVPLVKSFQIDLQREDLFDRYLVTEEQYIGWRSNYLYEEYRDERGLQTAYIYLYASPSEGEAARMRNLQCVWDDMVFLLWDKDRMASDRTADDAKFPYRGDGNVQDVLILYDEPCKYSRISDTFGKRVHPYTGESRVHEGIDYVAKEGTDIVAAADGIVYETGFLVEYGNYVVLLHQNGDMTYYCHCRDITVSKEEQVKRGDCIATVGCTGRSTGAHLHFALSRAGIFIDPAENMNDTDLQTSI